MADQDEVNAGAIPPKVSPFAKPGDASPVTPAAPGAPRPITVRLKPVAPTGSVPTGTGAVPTADVAPAAPAAVGIPAAPPASPRSTSRVPVPEGVGAMPSAIRPATVRLRPVAAPTTTQARPPVSPSATVPVSLDAVVKPPAEPLRSTVSPSATVPVSLDAVVAPTAASPLTPQHPPTPGAHPIPDGPKPPSAAQVQAAKSKTSRISLDSAIGVAPVEKEGPKTIRLKRPSDLAAPTPTVAKSPVPTPSVRQTSRIPDSALPTAETPAGGDNATVTQKKTLKIKRPGAPEAPAAEAAAGGEGLPEGVQMTPISAMEFPPAKEESSVFTVISTIAAAAAALVLAGLVYVLAAHAIGSVAGKNAVAFREGPDLPMSGRIVN